MTKKAGKVEDHRKAILAKALVDPRFRRKLFKTPEAVFGRKLTTADLAGLERIRRMLPAVDDIVTHLAGEVLCGGGGGCGGLA